MRDRKFITLRYYIIKSKQQRLISPNYTDDEDGKKKLFCDNFLKNETTYQKGKSLYELLDIEIVDDIFYGKFCRKGQINLPKKKGPHIQEIPEIEYPYSYFVGKLSKNILCIEIKTKVFNEPEKIRDLLSKMVTEKISSEGYICTFETIDEKQAFWTTIDSAKKIYFIELRLNSPNLFDANRNAREYLKSLQDEFNNTSSTIKLENEDGNLKFAKTAENKDYVEYIEGGAGRWKSKTDKGIEKSTDKVLTIRKKFKDFKQIAESIIEAVSTNISK